MILTTLFISLFLISYSFSAPPKEEIDCQKSIDQIDRYGRELFLYGDRDHTFPYKIEDVEENHCKRLRKAVKGIRSYTQKCLKPFPRQVIGLIIHGATKTLRKRCKNEASIFVEHAKCVQNKNVELAHRCMDEYINKLEAVRDLVNNKDHKIPYTCCVFYDFKACVEREAQKICNSKDAVEYMKKNVQEVAEEAIQLTCKGYEENSGKCSKLPKLVMKKSNRAQSIISPLVTIYTEV